ncbi:MAG TPA: flagellar hook-length control protein FliK, partial [Pseudomonadales bacterium]|nr:flagellar hook-length control protein FliK [Pseudomonadales bacterium]
QSADISINPPDMGPIEAKVQLQQDQVNVTFSAQHAPVKEALEQSLPKLREMMAQNGVNLGNVDVRDYSQSQSQQQSWGRHESSHSYAGGADSMEAEEEQITASKQVVAGRGLVDFYA